MLLKQILKRKNIKVIEQEILNMKMILTMQGSNKTKKKKTKRKLRTKTRTWS
jgi:hypothetical protein